MTLQEYTKQVLSEIKQWLDWSGYSLTGDIKLEYQNNGHKVYYTISNQW